MSTFGAVVIRGVRLYGEGEPVDVLVADGQIAEIGAVQAPAGAEVIEASGQVLLPGLVDLHTHLREPGREYAEDIETGSAAAALGGFTAVFAMANTDPVADSAVVTDHVWRRGQQVGLVDVHPVGAVTVGLEGRQLTEMGLMAAGTGQVRMFSDDGVCVADPLEDTPRIQDHIYWLPVERVITAILLGVLTYDGNLLVLEPPAKVES
jgi:dihydroorotase